MVLDGESFTLNTSFFDVATAMTKGARPYQEDALISNFAFGQSFGYVILADGMGGHAAGDVASALVASEMYAGFKMNSDEFEEGAGHIPLILRECAQAANERLTTHSAKHVKTKGMGTTLLAPVFSRDQLTWISIGDSPMLLFRDGALRQLNKDHSMAPEIDLMVKTGLMDEEAGRNHPDRNSLTSVLTGSDIAKIDCPSSSITLLPGDIIVVATDGLQYLQNTQIANLLAVYGEQSSATIADKLLSALMELDAPDQDNATFAVVKIGENFKMASALRTEAMPVLAVAESATDAEAEEAVAKTETAEAAPQEKRSGLGAMFGRGKDAPKTAEPAAKAEEEDEEGAVYYYYRGQRYKK